MTIYNHAHVIVEGGRGINRNNGGDSGTGGGKETNGYRVDRGGERDEGILIRMEGKANKRDWYAGHDGK